VVEQALETVALMLGTDKSRGYCLEMICADFLAGANLECGNPEILVAIHYKVLKVPARAGKAGIPGASKGGSVMSGLVRGEPRIKLAPDAYEKLCHRVLVRDSWRCQNCGSMQNLEVHHKTLRSRQGDDVEENLVTLCSSCHTNEHIPDAQCTGDYP
jgi:hypothetical protein